MKKQFLLMFLFMFAAILVLGAITRPSDQTQGVDRVDILIGFKQKPGKAEKALVEKFNGKIKYTYHLIPAIAASVPAQALQGLKHNPKVRYVEKDIDIFLVGELSDSWGVDRIDAEKSWAAPYFNKGAGILVSIIDTGIDKDHPDLVANIAGGVNFVAGKGKDKIADPDAWDDDHGHGTHCAGIVAADDNGTGVVGVAPDARLLGVKVIDNRGRGKASDFIAGLEWSVDNGAKVISISLQYFSDHESIEAACQTATSAGVLLVSSAGNNWGGGVTFPANLESVMAVSGTDIDDNLAEFSSDGDSVELAAPGVEIYSTYKDGRYTYMDGTSMACPHVAGAAALVWATNYYLNGTAVRFQLCKTAEDIGLEPWQQGSGLVDAEAAMVYPEPAFNIVTFGIDKVRYIQGQTEPALLTAAVIDEIGNPATGLIPGDFKSTLGSDPLYNHEPVDVTFTHDGMGTYTGEIDISSLAAGQYEVKTTVLTESGITGRTAVAPFLVEEAGGSLSVSIESDKANYTFGENIIYTVTVTDDGDPSVAIPGAQVNVELHTASGKTYLDNGLTDSDGKIIFSFKIKKPDGTGTYHFEARAYKDGYINGSSSADVEVN